MKLTMIVANLFNSMNWPTVGLFRLKIKEFHERQGIGGESNIVIICSLEP